MNNEKPTYHIEHASVITSWSGGSFLQGQIKDHPNCTNGEWQHTSAIVQVTDNFIETKNSIYIVDSWADNGPVNAPIY